MSLRVGIIGIGHLATYIVEGWAHVGAPVEVCLSPRNAERAAALSGRFGWPVADSNQAVIDASDVLLLSTPPEAALQTLSDLTFRAGQLVIVVCAGVHVEPARGAAAPAEVVMAMPLSSSSIGKGTTCIYPDDARAFQAFEPIGSVVVAGSAEEYLVCSAMGALHGWAYALSEGIAGWLMAQGVTEPTARGLASGVPASAASMAAIPRGGAAEWHQALMLDPAPGVTRLGLDHLNGAGAIGAWIEACDMALAKVKSW